MKQKQKLAAFIAAFTLSFPALAEENDEKTGFFIAPEIGQVKLNDWCNAGLFLSVGSGFNCEDAEVGYGLSGGYWFGDYFAAEVGLRVADGFDVRYNYPGNNSGSTRFELDFQSISLGFRGRFPFGERFAATGKVGMHFWEQELVENDSTSGVFRVEQDGTDPYFGIGAEFSFTDNIAVRAEYTRYNGDALDADFISASAVWNF